VLWTSASASIWVRPRNTALTNSFRSLVARQQQDRVAVLGELAGYGSTLFVLVEWLRSLLQHKEFRPLSDWGSSGRRFNSVSLTERCKR
jgi:hypothetical protein